MIQSILLRPGRARHAALALCAAFLSALSLSACGGDDENAGGKKSGGGGRTAVIVPGTEIKDLAAFPKAGGRSAAKVIAAARAKVNPSSLIPATNNLIAGQTNRVPFGVLDDKTSFVTAPTALYMIESGGKTTGPYPAKAYSLAVDPKFRSRTTAADKDIPRAVFVAQVPIKRPGMGKLMALSQTSTGMLATRVDIGIRDKDPVPAVGTAPPDIETPTVESAGGKIKLIETRDPPDEMHKVSFTDALTQGKPIVLVFATPALCASRMCGPVVDMAAQLQSEFGDRVTFIHQEIFNENDPNKGYRLEVGIFKLPTEPFTFVIGKDRKIVGRLEGPFGLHELREAIERAL